MTFALFPCIIAHKQTALCARALLSSARTEVRPSTEQQRLVALHSREADFGEMDSLLLTLLGPVLRCPFLGQHWGKGCSPKFTR